MAKINPVINGEIGASARGKINTAMESADTDASIDGDGNAATPLSVGQSVRPTDDVSFNSAQSLSPPTFSADLTRRDYVDLIAAPFTGVTTGGEISINAGDAALFDIAAGTGQVVDWTTPSSPVVAFVSWTAFTAEAVPNIAADTFTSVAIDAASLLVQVGNGVFSASQSRSLILIGLLLHPMSAIVSSTSTVTPTYNTIKGMQDYIGALGGIVSGSTLTITNSNLTFGQTSGSFTRPFINYNADKLAPSTIINAASDPTSFNMNRVDGVGGYTADALTTLVDPANYDDLSGSAVPVPASNPWTFQPVYYFGRGNLIAIVYGQKLYSNKSAAVEGTMLDFNGMDISPLILNNGTLLGFFILERGASDLTDPGSAGFVPSHAIKFGS